MTTAAGDAAACGERIEQLLEASAAAGPVARERAEELVRLVVDLYGAGLERLLEIAHDAGALSDELLDALAADELVASLLLVHGLHPYGLRDRVERALSGLRPSLGGSAEQVRVLEVSADGVVRLEVPGGGCGSSAAAVQQAVEDAVRAAAPEAKVEVVRPVPEQPVIGVDQLTARLRSGALA